MIIDSDKIYIVDVNRTVQVGRVWLRPGTHPHLLGRVVQELGDAVTVLRQAGA